MVTKESLLLDLRNLGARSGDTIMVHSSLVLVFKAMKGTREQKAKDMVDALLESVGQEGTLLSASYYYDFPKTKHFDICATKSQTGVLADLLFARAGALRTQHPMFSFVVYGRLASWFCKGTEGDAFGADSVFSRLRDVNGKVLLLGVDYQNGFTFVHHVEQAQNVDYRAERKFTGTVVDAYGKERVVEATAWLRKPGVLTNVCKLGDILDSTDAVHRGLVGDIEARLIDSGAAFYECSKHLKEGFTYTRQTHMSLAKELWPLHRSLAGDENRKTLDIIRNRLTELEVHEIPSGTECFDWRVPKEWKLNSAQLVAPSGAIILSYPQDGTLSVVSYSIPVDKTMTLEDLQDHLFSVPERPNAVPYVTSYYSDFWGFCLPDWARKNLPRGYYRAVIDSKFKDGSMSIGSAVYPGATGKTVVFSTNICHPSMAVNEISGMVVTTALAEFVRDLPDRKYTYQFIFAPETIGALAALSQGVLRKNVYAGACLYCLSGTPRAYAGSRSNSISDRVAMFLGAHPMPKNSDERQYSSPNVNLPIIGLTTQWPFAIGYHTSDDNLSKLSEEGFCDALSFLKHFVRTIETNSTYKVVTQGEPFLCEHGLYSLISTLDSWKDNNLILQIIDMCDGHNDTLQIAEQVGCDYNEIDKVLKDLTKCNILRNESWKCT